MDFLNTFINVLMVVVLAVPGYFLRKAKLLPENTAGIFAVLLLYISQPFLMMSSLFDKKFESSMLLDFAWILLFAVVLQLLVYFAAKLFFVKEKDMAAKRACEACSYLGNVGFMGIPVMQMLFPDNPEMILYTVVYNIAFNAMTWTLGVFAITGDRKRINPLKIILNPPTIAVIIALPLFFCNVPIPAQIMTPIRYLGDMTLPLSMIILGLRLADMRLISLVNDWKVYMVAFVKLIVSPLLCLGVLMLCGLFMPIGSTVIIALYIIAAMPTASSALNFAEMYGGAKETAAAATLMNTILCIATIPILMLLAQFV